MVWGYQSGLLNVKMPIGRGGLLLGMLTVDDEDDKLSLLNILVLASPQQKQEEISTYWV
jgi:hypothetical protein